MWQAVKRSLPIPIPGAASDSTPPAAPAQPPLHPRPSPPPVNSWVSDSAVTQCAQCSAAFSLFLRRHHCRLCGRVFCYRCSSHKAPIPEVMSSIIPSSPPTVLGSILTPDPARPRRLCDSCYQSVDRKESTVRLTRVLSLAMRRWFQLDDRVMSCIAAVSKGWNEVACLFRRKFHRAIRSRLVTDTASSPKPSLSDETIMRANALLCCRHYTHALPRIALLLDQDSARGVCVPRLHVGRLDIGTAIASVSRYGSNGHRVSLAARSKNGLASRSLYTAAHKKLVDLSDEGASALLTRLSFLPDDYTLQMFLLAHSPAIQFRMYWLLRVYRPTMAQWLVSNTTNKMNRRIADSLTVARLIEDMVAASDVGARRSLLRAWIAVHGARKPWFPGLPGRVFCGADAGGMSTMASASLPVVVPCRLVDHNGVRGIVNILYKRESVLHDATMMDCLQVCRSTLRRTASGAVPLVRYAVTPLSASSGLVAMVPKSRTLHGITQSGITLQNYLLEHNAGSTVQAIRKVFLESAALCCVQSMLFGLGDRHLENILLTEQGALFHVDYSYMFGREPSGKQHLARNDMKITPSMVDILGGQNSHCYQAFRERTAEIVQLLRPRANLFATLCESSYLAERSLSRRRKGRERVLRHFYKAFRPGQTEEETKIQILNLVAYNTQHRKFDAVLDRLHHVCTKLF